MKVYESTGIPTIEHSYAYITHSVRNVYRYRLI